MMRSILQTVWALFMLVAVAQAQFNFFDQMFGNNQQQQGHRQGPQDVPSDSVRYQNSWSQAQCSNYLCPGTLACVSVPHHCPCPHPDVEEKVELGEGSAICVSKGGFKAGEALRKIELARKGLL
ncbi:Long chronological lifespan protein 2 [Penicillium verhagenii]|uniref:Long chronological lifespan protein 2 n=1 Tax=Penicillium verhagenii TaxID=1562060 RepID=UPI0025451035|nr:Long chronological lifespan protein 2 [Penicillium verhagenii]KAJ5947514.1 Long chronological lifespan protein 2 [Penicillium verhagenii]